jgi:hypothetical protein
VEISPWILIFPFMKAAVGFSSPFIIENKNEERSNEP